MYNPFIQPENCYLMLIAQSIFSILCLYTWEEHTKCTQKSPDCVTDLECNNRNLIVASEYFSEQDKVDWQSH